MLAHQELENLLAQTNYHSFIIVGGVVSEEIVSVVQEYGVAEIVMGKRGNCLWENVLVGSVSQAVLESSLIPVVIVH